MIARRRSNKALDGRDSLTTENEEVERTSKRLGVQEVWSHAQHPKKKRKVVRAAVFSSDEEENVEDSTVPKFPHHSAKQASATTELVIAPERSEPQEATPEPLSRKYPYSTLYTALFLCGWGQQFTMTRIHGSHGFFGEI